MALAPASGLVPGGAAFAVAWAAGRAGLAPLLAAALGVGVLALATRGLHLDGLADTADGLAASYDRARALEVMKRGDVGPAGLATVVLVLLVQVSALAQAGSVAVLVAAVAARTAVPLACLRGIPAARPDGLGAHVAGSVSRTTLAAALAITALATAAITAAATHWWQGPAATAAALAAGALVLWRAVRRLGGMTGDVAGAAVEVATAAALVTLAGTAG
jgi:adenosylcobinamide-GDP ribazoletransferase